MKGTYIFIYLRDGKIGGGSQEKKNHNCLTQQKDQPKVRTVQRYKNT